MQIRFVPVPLGERTDHEGIYKLDSGWFVALAECGKKSGGWQGKTPEGVRKAMQHLVEHGKWPDGVALK